MPLRTLACGILLAALGAGTASAQCPDGSPPPCARPTTPRPSSTAPDPNRIAVLPFRVTTADSLLGEGLAELVATEFTGESGPRAVNMGTVLRAWRSAGGGLRSPLAQDGALRLAREVGAGRYVEGSVVGLGQRLTINASVVTVPGRVARRVPAISGPADSLDVLVGRLASALLAAAGGEALATVRIRLSESPAAMRAYLEGLAHWRASRILPAAAAFERAIAEDPGFARATLMRWLVGTWGAPAADWNTRVLALQDRLSTQDRLIVTAALGSGSPRSRSAGLADRQRAADQLPESAEAHYFLGDWIYHFGTSLNLLNTFERATVSLERSVALDPQGTVLQHLLEIALITGDTVLARRYWPAYDLAVGGAWDWGMAIAALAGDRAMLAEQRRRAGPIGERPAVAYVLSDALVPADAADEIGQYVERHIAPGSFFAGGPWRYLAALVRGRPVTASHILASRDTIPGYHELLVAAALVGDADEAGAAASLGALRAVQGDNAVAARAACLIAYRELRSGRVPEWNEPLLERRGPRCNAVLRAARAVRERRAEAESLLVIADSAARGLVAADLGLDQPMLARAWEEHGDIPRALAAIRLRVWGLGGRPGEAARSREEGRLAALVGDTTGAIRAYRRYLGLRRDAEPALVPQRDSVRAALTILERGR